MSTPVFEKIPDNLIEQARAASVLDLAEQRSELHRESAAEYSGPCPKCGGNDRFHCTGEWFFCRKCHTERGDAIELVQWLGLAANFKEAVGLLTGQGLALPVQPQRAPARAKPQRKQAQGWQRAEAERSLAQAQERLFAPAGEPGQQYLLSRALESHAWLTFGLGFDPAVALPGTGGKQRAPAVVLPWYRAGKLVAVRYRFLEAHTYTDIEGKERESVKLSSAAGCSFSGVLFGGQALLGIAQRLRTLVLCEGELNALSLWLVGHDTELDVLSTGSENHRITPAMVQALGQYRRVIVWADRPDITTSAMQLLPGAYGISSPGGQDANDLLQQGLLGGVLSAARAKACTSEHELEGLLWALWDAANRVQGVDTGTAKMIEWLASELGKQVILHEPEPGRWITKR